MPIVADVTEIRKGREVLDVPGYTRTSREEDNYFVTLYMGAPPDTASEKLKAGADKTLPQAYLVEQPPGSTIPAHYHDTDQYQVFVAGNSMFGKKHIGPMSVHFAGGHTPYGPILTQDEASHFFTLRAHWDGGGKPMPENRPNLQPVKRVYRLAASHQPTQNPEVRDDLIAPEDNGLGTALFTLEGDQTTTVDLPVAGGGQYALILDGSVTHDGTQLQAHSCLYRYPHEDALTLTGGPDGASVLLLQFPRLEALDTLSVKT